MEVDRALASDVNVGKFQKDYFMVRCADKVTSQKVKSDTPPALIFFDGDGQEYYRTAIAPNTIEAAYKTAQEKYAAKPVGWASGDLAATVAAAKEAKKLVALAFTNDAKDSEAFEAALGDRWLVKHQDKFLWVKLGYVRDSAEAKEWNVTAAPMLLLVDPNEADAKKKVIDRLVSKKEVTSIRAFLIKNIEKFAKQSTR